MFIPTYLIWDFFKKNESKHLLFLWIVDENGAKILILTKRVFQLRPRKAIQEYIKWFNSKCIQLKPKCCLTAPSIQFGVLLRRLSPSVPSEASMLSCLSLLIRWRLKFYIPSTIQNKRPVHLVLDLGKMHLTQLDPVVVIFLKKKNVKKMSKKCWSDPVFVNSF